MTNRFDTIAKQLMDLQPTADSTRFVVRDDGKWFAGMAGNGNLTLNHRSSRRQARRAMHDSPLCRAMVERKADSVADIGLRLELAPVIEVLGITRKAAAAWARDVEARFDLYCRDKKQHRSETLTFYQYQRLYQIFQHRDNDIFTRLFYDTDPQLQNPLQWDFVDPDQIMCDGETTTDGPQYNSDGIKRDSRGRELAYTVFYRKHNGECGYTDIPAKGASGRLMMLHGFRPEYAGQGRGYSPLAHAIQEFANITDFSAATIKKAINQSQIVGFVQPSKDEDAVNPFEGIMTEQGAGPATNIFGSTPTSTPIPVEPTGIVSSYQVPEATMDTPGSMFIANLTKGSTIQLAGNTAPADDFAGFVGSFASYISASTGTPLEVVLMKFGQNYSASRATLLLFWRIVRSWQMEMDADLLSPVVEMWLSGEIAAGRVVAPGWSDPRMRAAWLNKTWVGAPPPDIDPNKTANARKTNIEIGVTNIDRESRELNGSSAAANIEANRALFEDYPMAPWLITGGQQTDTPEKEDKEDE